MVLVLTSLTRVAGTAFTLEGERYAGQHPASDDGCAVPVESPLVEKIGGHSVNSKQMADLIASTQVHCLA